MSNNYYRHNQKIIISAAGQTLTGNAADFGSEIDCRGYNVISVFFQIDVNSSQNVRLWVLGKYDTGASSGEFIYDHTQINAPNTTAAATTENYIEFDSDADQLAIVRIPVSNAVPYIQVQVSAGTAGSPAGTVYAWAAKGY